MKELDRRGQEAVGTSAAEMRKGELVIVDDAKLVMSQACSQ